MFISLGQNVNGNNIATSNDGITWQAGGILFNNPNLNWYCIGCNGKIWLAGGDGGNYVNNDGTNYGLAYSYDSINWVGIDTTSLSVGNILNISCGILISYLINCSIDILSNNTLILTSADEKIGRIGFHIPKFLYPTEPSVCTPQEMYIGEYDIKQAFQRHPELAVYAKLIEIWPKTAE
jgi:hypothetical protein